MSRSASCIGQHGARRDFRPARTLRDGLLLLAAVLSVAGCTATASPPTPGASLPTLDPAVRAFLREPLLGYEGAVSADSRAALAAAWARLEAGDVLGARAAAEDLAGAVGDLLPATVLLAQTHLAAGEPNRVVDLLKSTLSEYPEYVAGWLVHARSLELIGDLAGAWGAWRGIADRDERAARQARDLESRAVAALGERLEASLLAGAIADAARDLDLLRAWSSDAPVVLELERRVARGRGDAEAELAATVRLLESGDESLDLRRRQADLLVEVGDAGEGLELYRRLAEQHPDDAEIAAGLASARFAWRGRLLPEDVAEHLDARWLLRGDFAALLAWLVPGLRTGQGGSTVIVSDIAGHPHRREIARLLNLGVMMPMDGAVRRFAPGSYLRRGEALDAMLRVGNLAGLGGAGASCLAEGTEPAAGDTDASCAAASRCGLLDDDAACRPEEAISGPEAVELLRRTLDLVQEP